MELHLRISAHNILQNSFHSHPSPFFPTKRTLSPSVLFIHSIWECLLSPTSVSKYKKANVLKAEQTLYKCTPLICRINLSLVYSRVQKYYPADIGDPLIVIAAETDFEQRFMLVFFPCVSHMGLPSGHNFLFGSNKSQLVAKLFFVLPFKSFRSFLSYYQTYKSWNSKFIYTFDATQSSVKHTLSLCSYHLINLV